MTGRYWIVGLLVFVCAATPRGASAGRPPHSDFYTPLFGSADRRMVLDVMRTKVAELHGFDVVFVVKRMEISKGWVWAHTLPQSKDGRSRYEDFFALLHKSNGKWRIAEIPCTEPDNVECVYGQNYFRNLRQRFPGMPDFGK